MNRKAKRLVDDVGALRVCRIMRFFSAGYQATNFRIRSVGPEDSNPLFRLANDPETRQNAFQSKPLSFEEHAQWLDKKMNDSQTTAMYVLEYEGAVLAQIRYDKIYPDTADIDISVHPAFRRRGYGTAMLTETRNAAGKQLEISSFRGVVFQENDAYRHCFIKAGFREKEKTMLKGRTCFIYEYRLDTYVETLN
jgi:RimJ/RimL family protein N-acetyltransferase